MIIKPIQFFRLIKINMIIMRHSFTRTVIGKHSTTLRLLSYLNPWSFAQQHHSRGEALRITLEKLGPIFVKFGQVLSTRQDLLPADIIEELSKLQDSVSPFPGKKAIKMIEASLKKPMDACFSHFESIPLASASIAQVHAARLHDGSDVIVKVLRPNILAIIQHDVALMYFAARLTKRFWRHGKRLRPVEIVAEFEQIILDELDLSREAANASQLRRNFHGSKMMYVPKVYWPFISKDVMVMERIYGIRISDIDTLKAHHVDLKKLAEYGVEIFFTQVLRDSFFHADMHPGNLFVDIEDPNNPFYLGVDFGIMGSLSPEDQHYLAENLVAFFNRDYRRVAMLHIESGWVPPDTRVEQFEAAIRTVSEPIFEKPLKDISFGHLLLNLFQVAKRFHMEVQPQLMLLQKTLLSIEGLGRQLYPDLDLWVTAKPLLEKWVRKRRGIGELLKNAVQDLPTTIEKSLEAPGIILDVIAEWRRLQQANRYSQSQELRYAEKPTKKMKGFFSGLGILLGASAAIIYLLTHPQAELSMSWVWGMSIAAGFSLLVAYLS